MFPFLDFFVHLIIFCNIAWLTFKFTFEKPDMNFNIIIVFFKNIFRDPLITNYVTFNMAWSKHKLTNKHVNKSAQQDYTLVKVVLETLKLNPLLLTWVIILSK